MAFTKEIEELFSKITVGELQVLTKNFFLNKIIISNTGKISVKGLNRKLTPSEKFIVKGWANGFKIGEDSFIYESLLTYFGSILLRLPEDEIFSDDTLEDKLFIRYNIMSLFIRYYSERKILLPKHQNEIMKSLIYMVGKNFNSKIDNDVFFKHVVTTLPSLMFVYLDQYDESVSGKTLTPFSVETYTSFIELSKEHKLFNKYPDQYVPVLKEILGFMDKAIKNTSGIKKWPKLSEEVKKNKTDIEDMIGSYEKDIETVKSGVLMKSFISNSLEMKSNLKNNIIGQDNVIDDIFPSIGKVVLGIHNRPSTFLFLGSSGVGKTRLAEEIALMMGGEACVINLGNFHSQGNMSSLIGAPPGYIGSNQETVIEKYMNSISKNEESGVIPVIVFDEIEKANSEIQNVWLELFDRGTITLMSGTILDLKKSIIIMTSNLGINVGGKIGFSTERSFEENMALKSNDILGAVEKNLKPEIINRIEKKLVFNDLKDEDYIKIKTKIANDSVKMFFDNNEILKKTLKDIGVDEETVRVAINKKIKNTDVNDGEKNIRIFEKSVENMVYETIMELT